MRPSLYIYDATVVLSVCIRTAYPVDKDWECLHANTMALNSS